VDNPAGEEGVISGQLLRLASQQRLQLLPELFIA
jgi:hypothetical protein